MAKPLSSGPRSLEPANYGQAANLAAALIDSYTYSTNCLLQTTPGEAQRLGRQEHSEKTPISLVGRPGGVFLDTQKENQCVCVCVLWLLRCVHVSCKHTNTSCVGVVFVEVWGFCRSVCVFVCSCFVRELEVLSSYVFGSASCLIVSI